MSSTRGTRTNCNQEDVETIQANVLAMSSSSEEGTSHDASNRDLEEGRSTSVAAALQDSSRSEDNVVDGDAVKTTIVDVDDLADARRLAETREAREMPSRERDFADCISAITDDYYGEDAFDDELPSNGKVEVPLSHYPDMDDVFSGASNQHPYYPNVSSHRTGLESVGATLTNDLRRVAPEPPGGNDLTPSNSRQPAAPGAFAVTPRNTVDVDGDSSDDETIGTIQILSSEEDSENQDRDRQHQPPLQEDMLVHATLVEDGDAVDPSMSRSTEFFRVTPRTEGQEEATNNIALVEAKPLHHPTFQESIRSKWTQCNILLVIGLISVAIALGVMALDPQAEIQVITSSSIQPSQAPPTSTPTSFRNEIDEMEAETPKPTFAPTVAIVDVERLSEEEEEEVPVETFQPTVSPTAKPLSRDEVYMLLPEHTKEAMKSNLSPQFQAYDWVWRDPELETFSLDRTFQRFALMTVMFSIGLVSKQSMIAAGDDAYSGRHECDWIGGGFYDWFFECDEDLKLTTIHLRGGYLKGTLPEELSMLSFLDNVVITENELTGTLPASIGEISGLRTMNFSTNALSGTLPYSIASMRALKELDLSSNKLASSLPAEIGFLTALRHLSLAENYLTGKIPTTLRFLRFLKNLYLNNNQLSAALPTNLGELGSAQEIRLNANRFSGTMPSDFGLMSNLRELNLSDNMLSGTVPTSLGQLFKATSLDFHGNSLAGTLPVEVCALLETFGLSEVTVDCEDIDCFCLCTCFDDQPATAVTKSP